MAPVRTLTPELLRGGEAVTLMVEREREAYITGDLELAAVLRLAITLVLDYDSEDQGAATSVLVDDRCSHCPYRG